MLKQISLGASLLMLLVGCQSTPEAAAPFELIGTWQIEEAAGKPLIDYSPAQLTFAADNKFSGNNSCNNIFGDYVHEDSVLRLSPAGSTKKACVDALMQQEQRIMQVLTRINRLRFTQGKLILLDERGHKQLVLSRR
ncbi:META domain-containing protein [Shewanella cyperi]|uniref:META domain-containing protein n=1 Tax=Shewanella cyperi TaxID=2814292 RepID=A0A974XL52_9GAMM|nr:META domain-containing protein [Shewanella cyperi]QSX29258.1 META domain-containing protein [Shewanella cyperi]